MLEVEVSLSSSARVSLYILVYIATCSSNSWRTPTTVASMSATVSPMTVSQGTSGPASWAAGPMPT